MGYNLDELIFRLQKEFERKDRSGIYAETQKLLAYNSNKMEGSKLSLEQTSFLFDTGAITIDVEKTFRSKDVEEADGHFLMFNYMLKNYDQPLSIKIIKDLHYNLKAGVFEDRANGYPVGEFKNRPNKVSLVKTSKPEEVENDLLKLLNEFNSIDQVDIEDIARLHFKFEEIHPFQDGNGRVGRMIIYKECLKANILPLVISDSNKVDYYRALREATANDNIDLLTDLFIKEQENYLNNLEFYQINVLDEPSLTK